jgi:hypothetical protein
LGEKEEEEKEIARGLFSQCWTHLDGCAIWDFCGF